MKMKKNYIEPQMDIVRFDGEKLLQQLPSSNIRPSDTEVIDINDIW